MSVSLTQLATAAAQLLHVTYAGETLSSQQLTDLLGFANSLLDNFSSEQAWVIALTKISWPLTAATQGYTIGTGQTINVTRPMALVSAAFQNSSGPGGPVEVCNIQKWESIPDRQRQSYIIEKCFYDRGNPSGNVYVSPVPLGSTLSMDAYVWAALTQFADTTTPITFPPGYQDAFTKAFAVLSAAPYFGVQPDATLLLSFQDAVARIRNLNAELIGTEPPAGQATAAAPQGTIAANQGAQ